MGKIVAENNKIFGKHGVFTYLYQANRPDEKICLVEADKNFFLFVQPLIFSFSGIIMNARSPEKFGQKQK